MCLRLLDLRRERLDLCLDGLAQRDQRGLGRLTGSRHDLAGRGEDEVLRDRLAALLEGRLELLGGGRQLLAARPHQLVGAARLGLVLAGDLRALFGDGRLQLGALDLHKVARPRGPLGQLLIDPGQRLLTLVLVDARHDVQREIQDPLQVARADIEEDAEARRRPLEVPDVADRAGQLDVPHPLAADLAAGDLDATLVADDALVADPLVLAAVALPVLGGTEDALVEETVLLRLEGAVVDRLRLGDLSRRPALDLIG